LWRKGKYLSLKFKAFSQKNFEGLSAAISIQTLVLRLNTSSLQGLSIEYPAAAGHSLRGILPIVLLNGAARSFFKRPVGTETFGFRLNTFGLNNGVAFGPRYPFQLLIPSLLIEVETTFRGFHYYLTQIF
jgi:hypothetical protein